jgi:hypothetical protein
MDHLRGRYTRADVRAYLVRVPRSACPLVLILLLLGCPVVAILIIGGRRMPELG